MKNIDNKEIEEIEINLTKKLLHYIDENIDIEEILQNLDFISPYMQDESSRISFNIWLSMDYISKEDKTFIESFMEEKTASLTHIEKQILKEKSISHISLFQILKYEGNYMYLRDILNNKEYKIWMPHFNNALLEGEYLFSRLGKILDEYRFIGEINYLPSSIKPVFMEELLIDFNNLRKDNPELTMQEYLKIHSLNVYRIYHESILDNIGMEGDIHSYLFDELEEFESYLLSKNMGSSIQKHLTNLVNLFEYSLSDKDMTLYDLDLLDLKDFFEDAIENSFINSQDELNSYINTLKIYLSFLNTIDDTYKDVYLQILNISKNRFYYMNKLNIHDGFYIDKEFVNQIVSQLNDDALAIAMDYEKFLLFVGENPLELTTKNKHIKRKYLWEIDELLESKNSIKTSAPNQKSFPLIHFFYYVSLNMDILEIDDNDLILTNKGVSFLRLEDAEKYYILFKYLWSNNFISDILLESNIDYWEDQKNIFINIFSKLKSNNEYNPSNIFSNKENIFLLYSKYLKYFGLIEYKLSMDFSLIITDLGGRIFKYLNTTMSQNNSPTIIDLNKYRKTNCNINK